MTMAAYLAIQALREPAKVYEAVLLLRRRGIIVRRKPRGLHATSRGTVDNAGLIALAKNFRLPA